MVDAVPMGGDNFANIKVIGIGGGATTLSTA